METWAWVGLYAIAFVFGSVIASFLNVLIYRLPRGLDPVRGRSFCPQCEHTLHGHDLVPVFSWLFLKGRCRYCRGSIPFRYAAVELLGGGLAMLCVGLYHGAPWQGLLCFAVLCILVVIAFVDADTILDAKYYGDKTMTLALTALDGGRVRLKLAIVEDGITWCELETVVRPLRALLLE